MASHDIHTVTTGGCELLIWGSKIQARPLDDRSDRRSRPLEKKAALEGFGKDPFLGRSRFAERGEKESTTRHKRETRWL